MSAPPPDIVLSSARQRLVLLNLLTAIGFGLVAMTICLPSMPSWQTEFGASQARVQVSFSIFVIAFGVGQVIYGPLSDRYGRRRLMVLGFVIAAFGSIGAALTQDFVLLTASRFVQGAGAAAGMVLGRAMVQDYFSGADRSRVMAYIGMAMGLCAPIATVVGGQLHVWLGWRANFYLIALLAMILAILTLLVIPVEQRAGHARSHWLREMLDAYSRLARVPPYLAYVAILSLSTGSFYIYLAGAPSVLANFGVGPDEVGFFIMFVPLSYIVGSFITSRIVKRFTDAQLMLSGHLVSLFGIGLALALALLEVRSPFAVAGPLIFLGIGQGLLMPSALSGTVSVVPALAGAAAGAAGLAQQLTGAFAGYAVGLFHHTGSARMAILMLVFMSLAFAAQIALRGMRHDPLMSN